MAPFLGAGLYVELLFGLSLLILKKALKKMAYYPYIMGKNTIVFSILFPQCIQIFPYGFRDHDLGGNPGPPASNTDLREYRRKRPLLQLAIQ